MGLVDKAATALISKIDGTFRGAGLSASPSDPDRGTETSVGENNYYDYLKLDQDRLSRYNDYDKLEKSVRLAGLGVI